MIENFLRRPSSRGELAADVVRIVGLLSIPVALVWWSATDAGILAFALPALLLPRFVGARPWFDIAYGITVLVASWSNVLDLYRTVTAWDLVVHFFCTAVLAAAVFLWLGRAGMIPLPDAFAVTRRGAVLLTTALGLALSALWEMVEWIGFTFISDDIFVTYDDTIGDMAFGGLGALAAGFVVASVRLLAAEDETKDACAPGVSGTAASGRLQHR